MESNLAIAQAKYWQLRQLGMFADLDGSAVRRLGEHSATELIEAGRTVYRFGDLADRVYVLKSGCVRVSRASDDGKELTLYFVRPGEIFGELAIVGKERRSTCAMVIEDAFMYAVARDRFEHFMLGHPEISLAVARTIGRRKELTERRMLDLVYKDVRSRVAGVLAELADEFGASDELGVRIDLPLTQTDLAQLVGSTRETTSTVFNELRRAGLVEAEGRTVWVLDTDALGGKLLSSDARKGRSGQAA